MNWNEAEANTYGQSHIFPILNALPAPAQQKLQSQLNNQLASISLSKIHQLFQELVVQNSASQSQNSDIQPLPCGGQYTQNTQAWQQQGEANLRNNQVAAFLVAGGQGSRLGFEGPKGMYDIGLPSHKSLFQLQAERILKLQQLYNCTIPWYIMTSPLNHEQTTEFFTSHNYFGLSASSVFFFSQGMLPAVDAQGRMLFDTEHSIGLVPDGNGGCFQALAQSGALQDMQNRGITQIFVYSVDNALVQICDPVFLGFLHAQGAPAASKTIAKRSPEEKVGIFAQVHQKPIVIEYSDLQDELRYAQNEHGLVFDGANIAVHGFTLDALLQVAQTPLPYHVAHKKVSYYDHSLGQMVHPSQPNAYKFEQFLFDIFPFLGRMDTFLSDRNTEFAPVKNAEGADSPASARNMIGTLHCSWLAPYIEIPANTLYEISPLLSYAGEGLNAQIIQAGLQDGTIRAFAKD